MFFGNNCNGGFGGCGWEILIILILLCCCGKGLGGFDGGCGFSGGCEWILILLVLFCCCGRNGGGIGVDPAAGRCCK